jgi:putative transcriptional regulator
MPTKGDLLISEPFLGDPNFERSVVLLCEHNEEGSFGFVWNKGLNNTLGDLVPDLPYHQWPTFLGGPVCQDALFFCFRNMQPLEGSVEVLDNVFWGGDFQELLARIQIGEVREEDIRFFVGYSGWSEGQLDEELRANAWVLHPGAEAYLFGADTETLWRQILKDKGGKYKEMANYPIDPRLN